MLTSQHIWLNFYNFNITFFTTFFPFLFIWLEENLAFMVVLVYYKEYRGGSHPLDTHQNSIHLWPGKDLQMEQGVAILLINIPSGLNATHPPIRLTTVCDVYNMCKCHVSYLLTVASKLIWNSQGALLLQIEVSPSEYMDHTWLDTFERKQTS